MVIALRRETHSSKNTYIYHIAHGFIYCFGTWLNAEVSIPFEIECNIFWYKHLLGSPSQWPTQLLIQRRGFCVNLRRNNAPVSVCIPNFTDIWSHGTSAKPFVNVYARPNSNFLIHELGSLVVRCFLSDFNAPDRCSVPEKASRLPETQF